MNSSEPRLNFTVSCDSHRWVVQAELLHNSAASISFLGTGCAIPSKYRNVSGILLQLNTESSETEPRALLIDAGEGTWAQLMRIQYETMSIQNSKQAPTLSQVSSSVAKMLRVVGSLTPTLTTTWVLLG
jgi:hypothetical protein